MSKKTFSLVPKPNQKVLSEEQIRAYESSGPGHDTNKDSYRTRPEFAHKTASEPIKRLSLDLPQSLHRRFKMVCVATDRRMLAEIQNFIEQRTDELEKEAGIK